MEKQVEVVWQEWRHRGLNIATISTFAVAVPLIMYTVVSDALLPSVPMVVGFSGGLVLLGMATLARSLSNSVRMALWLAAGFITAFVGLVRMGTAGSGRLFLMAMPLIAYFLAGSRLGRGAAAFSFLVFAAMVALTTTGHVNDWLVLRENPTETGFWLVQAATWAMIFIPMAVVIDRFLHLRSRTILSEQSANQSLREEIEERARLGGTGTTNSRLQERANPSAARNSACTS